MFIVLSKSACICLKISWRLVNKDSRKVSRIEPSIAESSKKAKIIKGRKKLEYKTNPTDCILS